MRPSRKKTSFLSQSFSTVKKTSVSQRLAEYQEKQSKNTVSLPPVINAAITTVTTKTKNLFVEITGINKANFRNGAKNENSSNKYNLQAIYCKKRI